MLQDSKRKTVTCVKRVIIVLLVHCDITCFTICLLLVDLAKVMPEDLKPALSVCNYLVYGYIGIDDDDYKAESLDKSLDTEKGKNLFKTVTDLKKQYPALKVLLSVGGFADHETPEKYLKAVSHSTIS